MTELTYGQLAQKAHDNRTGLAGIAATSARISMQEQDTASLPIFARFVGVRD